MNPVETRNTLSDSELNRTLRSLPARFPPPGLSTALRVLSSREAARRRFATGERLAGLVERLRFSAGIMVRPLALPMAGGLFSAVVLFSMCVVPAYPLRVHDSFDVPTVLTTGPAVRGMVPIGVASGGDAVVEITIDEHGRMVDYKVVSGAEILGDPTLRRRLENTLLFTQFIPATAFGMPTTSTVRLSLSFSQVDVKG
jgi:hypothetical protein